MLRTYKTRAKRKLLPTTIKHNKQDYKADITIVTGDLNAKVGSKNQGMEKIMGKHGIGMMNSNGERLVELCLGNNLVIGGTLFPYKTCNKIKWVSLDQEAQNQIDHIMISRQWTRSLMDVRNKRSADAADDHYLLTEDTRIKLDARRKKTNKSYKTKDI